jgi:hypothetical protein
VLTLEQRVDAQAHGELDRLAGRTGRGNHDNAARRGLGRAKGLGIRGKGVVTLDVHGWERVLVRRVVPTPEEDSPPLSLLHQSQHLAGLGMPTELLLGKHRPPVDVDFEHAAGRLDQLHFGLRVRLANLCRQTGGSGLVVSNDTVFDHYSHSD